SCVDGGTDRAGQRPRDKDGEDFAAAGGDDQDVIRPQTNVFRLSNQNLPDIHRNLLVLLPIGSGAEYQGVLRFGGVSQTAGQRDGAEDGDGTLAAQVEGAGALHVSDDVYH